MIFSKRKTIGVFITRTFVVFDDAVFHALEREAKRLNYDIVVFMTVGYYMTKSEYDLQEKNIFRFAAIEKLDGIIIVPDSYQEGEFRDLLYDVLRRAHCPVVAIRHKSNEYDCVYTDENEAIRPLIRHLIEDHGLKRICFQKGLPRHVDAELRLAVFRDEMAAHGLPVPESAVCPGNLRTNCGEAACEAFFSDPENPPEAVVCANDYMAVGLMRALRKRGIRVPEDVIVTGFDNISDVGVDEPSLTTIQPDYDGMVVRAMELLDEQLRGVRERREQTQIAMNGQFVPGESCGCGKRHPDYYRRMGAYAMVRLERESARDALMNNMSIALGACDDLSELHEVLISKRISSPILRDHYLCLFGEPGALMRESGDKACLVHATRDHRDFGMPMIAFSRADLLPPMAERPDEPQMLFVKLLHQKGHNFGYSVIQYEAGEVPSRAYVQSNALISIALENIYRRAELMKLYEERRLSSITDMLTGLLNRRGLMERAEPLWRDMLGRQVAFAYIDMDHLKYINDTYGHAAGDCAIRLVGQAIQAALPPKGIGARIGGDEFMVFIPAAGDDALDAFTLSFKRELDRLNVEEKRGFPVAASVGRFVKTLDETDTLERCIQASDRQMYQIKAARPPIEQKGTDI